MLNCMCTFRQKFCLVGTWTSVFVKYWPQHYTLALNNMCVWKDNKHGCLKPIIQGKYPILKPSLIAIIACFTPTPSALPVIQL